MASIVLIVGGLIAAAAVAAVVLPLKFSMDRQNLNSTLRSNEQIAKMQSDAQVDSARITSEFQLKETQDTNRTDKELQKMWIESSAKDDARNELTANQTASMEDALFPDSPYSYPTLS